MLNLLLTMVAVGWGSAPAYAASYDPKLTWQSLETDHFVITFHDGEEPLAREMAVDAEVAWAKLTHELGTMPCHKIDVVLVDWVDSANGYATLTPANHIVVYVTAPEGDSTLGLYRDWNEAIITHELTHILHLSTVEGLPRVVRTVLGTYVSTHQIEPRWIVEGFATYMETRYTSGGRGRSGFVDMVKRTAVLEDRFPPLGNMDGYQSTPPGGNLRYLWGQDFIQYLAERAGPEAWPTWVHRYGRSVPYFFHFKDSFGRRPGETGRPTSFIDLYREWRQSMIDRYQAQAKAVEAEGVTEVRVISPEGAGCSAPGWTKEGDRLAFSCADARHPPTLYVSDAAGTKLEAVQKRKAATSLVWRSDGKAIAYTTTHVVDLYNAFDDVYLYDLEKKKAKALTTGKRARDPDFSPDGSRLLVVTNKLQNNQLAVLTVDGQLRELTHHTDHTQYGNPRYSPDGQRIAVSVWQAGQRDLWIFDAEGRPLRRLTEDVAIDVHPAWSPDGSVVYFSSDRGGVPNVYAADLAGGHLWRVTNVRTGIYGVAPHPDGRRFAAQLYATDGSRIALFEAPRSTWKDLGPLLAGELSAGAPTATSAPTAAPTPTATPAPAAPPVAPSPGVTAPSPAAAEVATSPDPEPWGAPEPAAPAAPPPPLAVPGGPLPAGSPYTPGAEPDPLARRDDLELRPYSPWRTLLPPRYWLPAVYLTSTGDSLGLYGLAYTGGTDLLNHLGYSAVLTYRTDARFVGGAASVYVNRWRPVFGASFSDLVTPYGDIYREQPPPEGGGPTIPSVESTRTRYWDHRLRTSVSMGYPLDEYSSVSAFFQSTLRMPLDPLPEDPYYPALPTRGLLNSVGVGWSRSKGESYPLSISPEHAYSLGVGAELTSSVLGSSVFDDENQRQPFDQLQATAEWRRYVTAPWLANHVFAWRLAGGGSVGDRFRYGSFRLGGSFSENGITVVPSEWRMLRGYFPASDSGEWYWLASTEYRFPIWRVDRGVGTLPLFVKHVSGAVLADAGNAFDDASGLRQVLVGVGAEARLYFVYNYGAGIYARLGYAFSPAGDGIPIGSPYGAYLALGSSF